MTMTNDDKNGDGNDSSIQFLGTKKKTEQACVGS